MSPVHVVGGLDNFISNGVGGQPVLLDLSEIGASSLLRGFFVKPLLFLDALIRFIYMAGMNQSIPGAVRSHLALAEQVKQALINLQGGQDNFFSLNIRAIARSLIWTEYQMGNAPSDGQKKPHFIDGTSTGLNAPREMKFNDTPLTKVILDVLRKITGNSDPTFVSEEVMSLLMTAAETMEPEPLFETDLLAPNGLLIFETPMIINDYHPTTGILDDRIKLGLRGLAWRKTLINAHDSKDPVPGIHLIAFTDAGPAGSIYIDTYNRVAEHETGQAIDPIDVIHPKGTIDNLICTDYHAWGFGRPWATQDSAEYSILQAETPELISTISFIRRFFLTLMRFAWQEIILPTPTADIPRSERRAVERFTGEKKESFISVLRLRRARNKAEHETEGYTLQWRVVVRGHWRRQYYPTLGPVESDESHRLIWINPHIKGPEDAPIRYNHKVTAIVR